MSIRASRWVVWAWWVVVGEGKRREEGGEGAMARGGGGVWVRDGEEGALVAGQSFGKRARNSRLVGPGGFRGNRLQLAEDEKL